MITTVFLPAPLDDCDWCREVLATTHYQTVEIQGHALKSEGASLAALAPLEGAVTPGLLVTLDAAMLTRLAALYEISGATPSELTVQSAGESIPAMAFFSSAGQFVGQQLDPIAALILRSASSEIIALAASFSSEALQIRWPMALAHAASVQRAQSAPNPATCRAAWHRADVTSIDHKRPYAWFFGVMEEDLRFQRFDGSLGPQVKRAGFVMSDAVTVLPYDPRRDCVLVIEQFRFALWLRGAENCWSLEPIAGRVDPFETPTECALREAREEAHLVLERDKLVSVGNVYPSPGAITEFLFQFVALCDLPDSTETVAGLESEAEDIRSHVISFEKLMSLIATGEAQNGPLVLSAYWLAANRADLRKQALG